MHTFSVFIIKTGQGTISNEEQLKNYCLQEVHLKFLLTGLLSGLPLPPFAIRMCPPLTTKNLKQYHPLLAVGKCPQCLTLYACFVCMRVRYC